MTRLFFLKKCVRALGVELTFKGRDHQQSEREETVEVSNRVLIQHFETKIVSVKCEGIDMNGRKGVVPWPSKKRKNQAVHL